MPASLTPVNARTAIQKPVGSDVFSLAAINAMAQAIADRGEWASKSLIAGYTKLVDIAGDDFPGTTSYQTVHNNASTVVASFPLTVSVGDLVWVSSLGALNCDTADRQYFLRWHDGTDTVAEQYFTPADGKSNPFKVDGLHIVTSAGAKTYALQGKRGGSSVIVQGEVDLYVACIHVKLGAA